MTACSRSLLAVVLTCFVGCADFDHEQQEFCERNPERCGQSPDSGRPLCGNGTVDTGEVCDDGNTAFNDGCSGDCLSKENCGNGYVDTVKGEACDDGNTTTEAECPYGTSSCTLCNELCTQSLPLTGRYCGDGLINDATEDCDDNNRSNEDNCLATCKVSLCGDGYLDRQVPGVETCDDGNTTSEISCPYGTSSCTRCDASCATELTLTGPYCGDGSMNGTEACDDGNNTSETACDYGTRSCTRCSADCLSSLDLTGPYCGDNTRNGSEACDDGNTSTETACPYGTPSCTPCDAACANVLNLTGPYCGDNIRNGSETCDDGNTSTETSCPYGTPNCIRCNATCTEALNLTGSYCGDNVRNGSEACDDGNTSTEVSCSYGSATCTRCDATCSNVLNLTGPYCGDGITNGIETCDDGNTSACGTCSANCLQYQLAAATGRITIEDVADIRDATDTIALDDGVHPAVIFEFDRNGTYSSNHVPIPYTLSDARSGVASSLANAINSVGDTLTVTAVVSSNNVDLSHDIYGSRGNRLIFTTADTTGSNASITVSGMSGGGGYDCQPSSGCVFGPDCASGNCTNGICQ